MIQRKDGSITVVPLDKAASAQVLLRCREGDKQWTRVRWPEFHGVATGGHRGNR